MKNLKRLLVLAFVLFIPFVINVKAEETNENKEEAKKITIYLFRGEGCPHCAEAEEWFEELDKDEEYSKYYELKDFEVWYDENNATLMDDVAKALDTEANGVPFIVIGKKYFSGFSSEMEDDIKTAIKEAYESDDYKDIVAEVKEGTYKTDEEKKTATTLLPVIIVSVVALITVIAMIFFTKEK